MCAFYSMPDNLDFGGAVPFTGEVIMSFFNNLILAVGRNRINGEHPHCRLSLKGEALCGGISEVDRHPIQVCRFVCHVFLYRLH